MHDISELNNQQLPSGARLLKATAAAVGMAGILLITAILPAEYGIDPTGLGQQLGLTLLHSEPEESAVTAITPDRTVTDAKVLHKHPAPYREDQISLSILPRQGLELKAIMQEGDTFVFNWQSDNGPLYFDMHGEEINAKDEFTSFWIGHSEHASHGSFRAPFDGQHGWYWQNNGDQPVSVKLRIAGYYRELYQP